MVNHPGRREGGRERGRREGGRERGRREGGREARCKGYEIMSFGNDHA